jgi:hypothetical protein
MIDPRASIQGALRYRSVLKSWLTAGVLALLTSAMLFTTETNATAQPLATYQLGAGWATFGLVLPPGAARSGVKVGTLVTQTDVKTTWPDGSIRFAVVTARVTANGSYPVVAAAKETGSAGGAWPTAAVRLTIGGTIWTAALPSQSSDRWLDGPLVTESRALVAPTAQGAAHPFLRVLYDVRSYAGGAQRVDVTVQSTLDVASADQVTYDVAVDVGGTNRFTKTGVLHPYLMRWRKVFPTAGLTESSIVPDFEPAYQAQALPRISKSISQLDYPIDSNFDILRVGNLARDMGAAGGRGEVGPYPDWAAQYLVSRSSDMRAFVLRNGDLAGSWSMHISKPDGANLISIDERPLFWFDTRTAAENRPANNLVGIGFVEGTVTHQVADLAHQPSLAYVPYLLTGDRYYADEMAFWANFCLLRQPPVPDTRYGRNGSAGLLRDDQTRGMAWGLRNMADAAAYLPDTYPLKSYYVEKVANNLTWFDTYVAAHITPLETVFESTNGNNPQQIIYSQWQSNYLAWAISHSQLQGFSGGRSLLERIVRVQLRFFTDAGWPKERAAPYWPVFGYRYEGQPDHWYTTLAEASQATIAWYGNGYPTFAEAYGIDARLALMLAADRNMSGATASLAYLMSQPGMVDAVNRRPGWAIGAVSGGASTAAPAGLRIIR